MRALAFLVPGSGVPRTSRSSLLTFCFILHSLAALGQGHVAGEWEAGKKKVPCTPPASLLKCGLFDQCV